MAKKISLREFQGYLAQRLEGAAQGQTSNSLLGIRAGNDHWLLDLTDSGEIVSLPGLAAVPLTQPWFCGLANIRGSLYAVSDLARFASGTPTPVNAAARLLLVGARHGSNAALLISQLLGLRNLDAMTAKAAPAGQAPSPSWIGGTYTDERNCEWRRLNIRQLLDDPRFMEIGQD